VKNGRQYRYYVAQRVLKGDAAAEDDGIVRRVSSPRAGPMATPSPR
jgi:hypothetical protein